MKSISRPPPRELHPIPEVRQMLGGIANATVYKLIGDGTLPTVKIGRRRFATPDGIRDCITTLRRGEPRSEMQSNSKSPGSPQ